MRNPSVRLRLVAAAFASLIATTAVAQNASLPRLQTNEAYIDAARRQSTLKIDDLLAVFKYVLDSLPDRVKVYPTENYYYFRFVHDGVPYAGDFRLDPRDRDRGKVHFGYYEHYTGWRSPDDSLGFYQILGAAQGVTVEKVATLVYRISYKHKQVVFALNDLSQVRPPASAMGPNEIFLGPIFDESGIPFFLIFDTKLKIFLYVLNENARLADQLVPSKRSDRILIGKRTGFAFYRDLTRDRKILIGVFGPNSDVNNYLDGPFDQLPENFIKGNELYKAEIANDHSIKGRIDRLGHFKDGSGRFVIQPYMQYTKQSDLYGIDLCARERVHEADYDRCFVANSEPKDIPSDD